ncbi:hypothetical protein ACFL47_01700 [Candidatus Latescibacterota bacterium]
MDAFIDNIVWNFQNLNWEGPAMFFIIVLAVFSVFRQWHILLLTLLTIVIGWGVEDMMITNLETDARVIIVTLLIYCCGGFLVIVLSLFSFIRYAID